MEEVPGDIQSELKISLQAVSTAEDCLVYRPRFGWGLAKFKMGYCRMMPTTKEKRIQGRKTDMAATRRGAGEERTSDYNVNIL